MAKVLEVSYESEVLSRMQGFAHNRKAWATIGCELDDAPVTKAKYIELARFVPLRDRPRAAVSIPFWRFPRESSTAQS